MPNPIPPKDNIPEQRHEYSVVREEKTTEKDDGGIREIIEGYDDKGRMVAHAVFVTHPDGSQGHIVKYVSALGYWIGGFGLYDKDGSYIHGGTLAPEKLKGKLG